jgi:hypothetical protein
MRLTLAVLTAPLVLAAPAAAKTVEHDLPAAFAGVLPGVRRILLRMANQTIRAGRR